MEGLPSSDFVSKPQKYLIETNPVLTELKQFMSSDYLLAGLGYDPDVSAKRLGDGLYEQRLVQQAVVARTGQAFIDGQTSNEAQFRYLMNNAIASKQQLNLAVGVSLTSQQVAALTHDIVWLEEHEVNGEKVLVPVLYLAHANNRLGPTGALIAGSDVSLIAGQNLDNVGTLRAANNLTASAGNDLVNGGLIEAGNRLDLLAGNNLINKAGGIIAGRDVTLTAVRGDVINERTVTSHQSAAGDATWRSDFADSAARIEAANDLSLQAGRDVNTTGGVLQAGRDLSLAAGRDVVIDSAQTQDGQTRGVNLSQSNTTQLASTVSAGRDLTAQAGRNIDVIASSIDSKRDITMAATENLTLSSAADEQHFYGKSKNVTEQQDHVSQVAANLNAGGSVALQAGQNLAVISSRITAGKEAYLVAGDNLDLLAAQDSDYSLYDMKKKGGFGAKKTQRDEVTDVKHISSEIVTGGDLLLSSGGDQTYQVARLESGKDLTIESGGGITFEGVKDLHQESHEKSKSDLAWNSAKGKGNTDETLRQSQLVAQGELAIKAAEGLKIDVRQIDQHTVSQTIDAMVAADPQLAWLKEAEARGDVDWRLVKETHDAYKYSHSGLGQGAMLAIVIVVIVVTVLTAGSGTAATLGAAAGSAAEGAAVAAGMSATTATAIASAANAAAVASFSAAVSQSAVSVINNKGDLGAALSDVTSKDSLQSYLVSGIAAGFAAGVLDKTFGVEKADATKATHGFKLGTMDGASKFAGYTFAESGFGAVANTAIKGGSLGDNLAHAAVSSAADVISAGIYNRLGTQLEFSGLPAKLGAHALVGGLISELAGGDFKTGALAAGANEAFVASVGDKLFDKDKHDQLLAMTSQLIGLTVSAAAGGSSKDQAVAGWVASQATKYNSLDHPTAEKLLDELKGCKASGGCGRDKVESIVSRYEKLSADRSQAIQSCESRACVEAIQSNTIAMDDPVAQELMNTFRRSVAYDVPGLLQGDPSKIAMPSLGVDKWGSLYVSDRDLVQAKYISEGWLTPQERVGLAKWDKETDWLNRLAGKELSVEEKASRLVELTSMAGMGILTGRTGKIANGERPENFSPDGAERNGAFREAKRRSGIPVSQQPTKVSLNVDKRGKVQPGLIYEFTVPTSGGGTRKVVIRDDAGGHDFGSGNSQNRGAHFNDEAGGHYDY